VADSPVVLLGRHQVIIFKMVQLGHCELFGPAQLDSIHQQTQVHHNSTGIEHEFLYSS
jgi:hypothetical protein